MLKYIYNQKLKLQMRKNCHITTVTQQTYELSCNEVSNVTSVHQRKIYNRALFCHKEIYIAHCVHYEKLSALFSFELT